MTVKKRNAINDITNMCIRKTDLSYYSGDENTQTGSRIFSVLHDCADSILGSQCLEPAHLQSRLPSRPAEFVKLYHPMCQEQDCRLHSISSDCSIPAAV